MKTYLGFCDLSLTFTVAVKQNRSSLSVYGDTSDSSDNNTRFRKLGKEPDHAQYFMYIGLDKQKFSAYNCIYFLTHHF